MTKAPKGDSNAADTNYRTFTSLQNQTQVDEKKTVIGDVETLFSKLPLDHGILESPPTTLQRFFPSFLVLCSSVLFSTSQASIRYTTTNFDTSPFFITFFRGICQVTVAAIAIFAITNRTLFASLDRSSLLLVSLRGFLGSISIFLKCESLARLPVGTATSLFNTTPIFATLFGWLFLRETLSPTDKVALLVTTTGSVLVGLSESTAGLVSGAPAELSRTTGVVFALLAAMTTATALNIMRAMGTRVHFLFSVLSLGVGCALSPFLLYLIHSGDLQKSTTLFVGTLLYSERGAYFGFLGVAIFAIAGAMCLNRGAQLTPAGRVAMLRTFDIPVGFAVGFVLLREFPHSTGQILGCTIIAMSTFLVAFKPLPPS